MAAFSHYLANALIDHVLRDTAYTQPTEIAICLLTDEPPASATGEFSLSGDIEVSATDTGYERQVLGPADASWDQPASGATENSTAVTFPVATDDWGTITHVAIVDSSTYDEGNMLFFKALTIPKTINTGDTFTINIGNCDLSLS